MARGRVHIGTSGWSYSHWREVFYPVGLSAAKQLPYFGSVFPTVEINATFYRMPTDNAVKTWYGHVPDDFLFSIKASRYITHIKRLHCDSGPVDFLFERLKLLKKKLGCVLFQLPPSFGMNLERLESFLDLLPKKRRYTFEFRHPSWFNEEVYALLRERGVALCITDLKGKLSPEVITADFTYVRLHGPQTHAYTGSYGPRRLRRWCDRIEAWRDQGLDVFCYFDNDEKAYATEDALTLKKMMER